MPRVSLDPRRVRTLRSSPRSPIEWTPSRPPSRACAISRQQWLAASIIASLACAACSTPIVGSTEDARRTADTSAWRQDAPTPRADARVSDDAWSVPPCGCLAGEGTYCEAGLAALADEAGCVIEGAAADGDRLFTCAGDAWRAGERCATASCASRGAARARRGMRSRSIHRVACRSCPSTTTTCSRATAIDGSCSRPATKAARSARREHRTAASRARRPRIPAGRRARTAICCTRGSIPRRRIDSDARV